MTLILEGDPTQAMRALPPVQVRVECAGQFPRLGFSSEPAKSCAGCRTRGGPSTKTDNFLPQRLAPGIVFQKSATPRPGLLIGAGHSRFGGGAKRNGVEAIENNQFREVLNFAPLIISRAYACVANPFLSRGEANPCARAGFRLVAQENAIAAKSTAVCARSIDVAQLCRSARRRAVPNGAASRWNRLNGTPKWRAAGLRPRARRIDRPNSVSC